MTRTLIVTHYFPPEVGAPQARLSELACYWAEAGDEVTVLTGMPNHPNGVIPAAYLGRRRLEERVDGYRVVRTWLLATPNDGLVRRTLGHLSFMVSSVVLGLGLIGPVDVVVVSSPTFFSIFSAWAIARVKQAGLVVEVRDLWPAIFVELGVLRNRFIIRVLEKLELWAYGQADAVVVVSEGFRDDLVRRHVPAEKVHVIRNGVDLERFGTGPAGDSEAARSYLGARPGECIVLYLGAHGISHGLTSVAEAAAKLEGAPVHFAFVGEGATKAELLSRVGELGLTNVTMRPAVPRDQVPALLAAADICLVPLRDVGLFSTFIPSKLFEYLGAAKAVIGAVQGEAAGILSEAGAIVIGPEDPAALAEAIKELAADPDRRAAMGLQGRVHMQAHFDRRILAARYRQVLQAFPGAGRPGQPDTVTEAQNEHFRQRSASWSERYYQNASFKARLAVVGSAIREALVHAPEGRVLDFGGGTGVFSAVTAPLSSFTVCLDRSESMLARGKSETEATIHWIAGDERCLKGDACFDLILAIAVLEYVSDVGALLRSLVRLLGPNGVLLMTVPNPQSLLRQALRPLRWAVSCSPKWLPQKLTDQSYLAIRPNGNSVPWQSAAAGAGLAVNRVTHIPLGPAGPRRLVRPTLLVSLSPTMGIERAWQPRLPLAVYAPTLASQGGYAALPCHLEEVLPAIRVAIVGNRAAFIDALPSFAGEVIEVAGHFEGSRILKRYLRTHDPLAVVAMQNPVLPTVPIERSVIQNHYFVAPLSAAILHPYPRDWPRLFAGSIATALQVRRSSQTIVLNPAYPEYWRRWSDLRIRPNTLGPGSLSVDAQSDRSKTVAVVTSFYRFRGLHVAIHAFAASALERDGWQLVVHAAPGSPGYEKRCRRLAASTPGVQFASRSLHAQVTLSDAAVALFPSRLEGSSIAFLEALRLGPRLIAFDGPHFRASVGTNESADAVEWVSNWDPQDWGSRLRLVSRSVAEST